LNKYESSENSKHEPLEQMTLVFEEKEEKNEVLEELKNINPLEMTPMDAINKLFELKNMLKK
jgi:DNA mismatch repair protein MutS